MAATALIGKRQQPPSAAQPREEGGRGRNLNSGERVLCATCQRLIGQSNWSTLVNWSKSAVNSGQFCKNA
ncbi:hypothetical protein DEO72_LG5g1572 [Vigna unguiculata]|uniref:Uncharacterized protein n=1 Tax=Vigna unguiculata TaxID=3917 RepID=A0A4D6LXS7_VIGUN|nr:hypothetical protein DEO72_LG5g1572 [Vigna unguiculata]